MLVIIIGIIIEMMKYFSKR